MTINEAKEIITTACMRAGNTAGHAYNAMRAIEELNNLLDSGRIIEAQAYNGGIELKDIEGYCREIPEGYYGSALTSTDYYNHQLCGAEKIEL